MTKILLPVLVLMLSETAAAAGLISIDVSRYHPLSVLYNQAQDRALVEVVDKSGKKAAFADCSIASGLIRDCFVQKNGWFDFNRVTLNEIQAKFEYGLMAGYALARKTINARPEQREALARADRVGAGALMVTGASPYGYALSSSLTSGLRPRVSNLDVRAVQEAKQLFRTDPSGPANQVFSSEEGVMTFDLVVQSLFSASAQ